MGYHWVNPGLIDPVFDPLRPEVVLYAPGNGGNLRLVGVEWTLHVWVHEDNPDGVFAKYNPNVSCD